MIHKYKMNDLNIVLDVNSGSVHCVDEISYDILDYYKKENLESIINILKEKYNESDIKEAYSELKELEENEVLFSPDIFSGIIPEVDNRKPVVKALCLHIAHDCNLKCKYCFAEEGEYHGKRSLMSAEVGKKAIDFLIENSGSRKNLEIDFFVGEPLRNFVVDKKKVENGKRLENN